MEQPGRSHHKSGLVYATRTDVDTLQWLRAFVNRPVLASEIDNKILPHKEALETLKRIKDELNRKEY